MVRTPRPAPAKTPAQGAGLSMAPTARRGDQVARAVFLVCALSVFAILGFIVWVLGSQATSFFLDHSLLQFFFHTEWEQGSTVERAAGGHGTYSILPLLAGTLLVTAGALLIGLPVGLATAIFLSQYASSRLRSFLKPVLEVLAGIPSIVFGFFALEVISPWVQRATAPGTVFHAIFGEQAGVFNALNAMIVVGVMVIPIITSLSEDALRSVPRHLSEASAGLGATPWETTRHVVLPAAVSGITASFVLAVARALGETMAVALAAGTTPNLTLNPVESIQTMTAFMVQRQEGDLPQSGPDYTVMFAVGATLFVMTLILNMVARRFVRRFREVEA